MAKRKFLDDSGVVGKFDPFLWFVSIGLLSFQLQYSKLVRFDQKSNYTHSKKLFIICEYVAKTQEEFWPGLNFSKCFEKWSYQKMCIIRLNFRNIELIFYSEKLFWRSKFSKLQWHLIMSISKHKIFLWVWSNLILNTTTQLKYRLPTRIHVQNIKKISAYLYWYWPWIVNLS